METLLVTLLGVDWKGFARFADEGSAAGTEARLNRLEDSLVAGAAREGGSLVENPVKAMAERRVLSFPAPSAALRAALALRAELVEAGYDVAMGLHAGECMLRAGNLLGAPIRETAALSAEGEAGEVLVTEVFRLTVSPEVLPPLTRVDRVVELAGVAWALYRLPAGEEV